MTKLLKYLKDIHLNYDVMIMFSGIALVAFIILTFINPGSRLVLLAAFVLGGLLNIFNGLKIVNDKKRRNMGMSYIFFGIIIIVIGIMSGTWI